MAVNQFWATSLTSIALVNPGNVQPAQPSATLSEPAAWISLSQEPYSRPHVAQPERVGAEAQRGWGAQLEANARSLVGLAPGWDGPGSAPVSKKALSRAVFYAKSALGERVDIAAPRLVPAGDGSVQIEWHTKRGELEFDIDDRGEMSIWVRNHVSGAEFDGEGAEALVLFYRWAPWIAARQSYASDVLVAPQMAALEFAA